MNQLVAFGSHHAPALVAAAGDRAAYRFLEFFTAQIRNPNTRRAYVKAVGEFCAWLERHGLPSITAVSSIHIAAYVEELGRSHSPPRSSSAWPRSECCSIGWRPAACCRSTRPAPCGGLSMW